MIGHHYPDQVLPQEMLDGTLVWQLVSGNMRDYFYVKANYTLLEVQEALAMQLTMNYLNDEEDMYDDDSPMK